MNRDEVQKVIGTLSDLWPTWALNPERNSQIQAMYERLDVGVVQEAMREHFRESGRGYPALKEILGIAWRITKQRRPSSDLAHWTWGDENTLRGAMKTYRKWVAEGRIPAEHAEEDHIIRHVIGKNPSGWERQQAHQALLRIGAANKRAIGDAKAALSMEEEADRLQFDNTWSP